jgi:hypothetical protein
MIVIQPVFTFDNDSIYPRQDEIWASQMWATIVRYVDKQVEKGTIPEARIRLEDSKRMQEDASLLYVVMGGEEYGLYWNGEYVCCDREILDLAAALLFLRSQGELVYKTTEEYQDSKRQQQAYDEYGLGDLDDHPF